jgi:hypothetical protein
MAIAPFPSQVKDMVQQVMQDQTPAMLNELERDGKLEDALDQRAAIYSEILEQNLNESLYDVSTRQPPLPFEEKVGLLEQGKREAIEAALAAALEFPPDMTGQG